MHTVSARSSRYKDLSEMVDRSLRSVVARLGDNGLTILYLVYW